MKNKGLGSKQVYESVIIFVLSLVGFVIVYYCDPKKHTMLYIHDTEENELTYYVIKVAEAVIMLSLILNAKFIVTYLVQHTLYKIWK